MIIRSSELGDRVRALPGRPSAPSGPDPAELERLALAQARDALILSLAEREAQIAALEAQVEAAYVRGEAEGRAAGRAEAADGAAERLERLDAGIARALAAQGDQLRILEHVAVVVAQAGLARILGADTARAELVADLVREQARSLASETVLEVEVSSRDFPEPSDLQALASEGLKLVALDLPSGACRLRLALGQVQADLDDQWAALRGVLADLATPEGAS